MDNKYLGSVIIPEIKKKIEAAVATKQDILVSGTNIKTINGASILGSGNIEIVDKLYSAYGQNEDGGVTQKFFTEKVQALENKAGEIEDLESRIEDLETAGEEVSGDIEEIQGYLNKVVQLDTTIAEDKSSTVTLVKKTGAINSSDSTETNLPLPVASKTQAGVINGATYATIYDTADALEAMEGAAVAIEGLSADADDDELEAAWKEETGKSTVTNGAKILDVDNGKTWTYYSNTDKWYAQDNENPTIEIAAFTNEAAGTILGSDVDGKVYAESDGTGSVKGWDTVKSDIATAQGRIDSLQSTVSGLDDKYDDKYYSKTDGEGLASDLEDLQGDVEALETTVEGKQDKLVSGTSIKTVNGNSLLGSGNVQIDVPAAMTVEEFEAAWAAA